MHKVILNFHGIGHEALNREPGEANYWLTPERFAAVLDRVRACRSGAQIGITFDDGNHSDIAVAAPLLARHGLTARFFVLADRLDTPGNLSGADLLSLIAMGHRIGTHGAAHVDWTGLDAAGFVRELDAARERIAEAAGVPVDEAAIPFGRYDRRVLAELRRRGYRRVYSSDGGPVLSDRAPLPRTSLRADTTDAALQALLDGREAAKRRLRRALGRLRKRVL